MPEPVLLPSDFKYRSVYLRGRPAHERTDAFSQRHPKMDVGRRAKLFAPFAALRGFDGELEAAQTVFVPRRALSAEESAVLDARLRQLHAATQNSRMVRDAPVTVRAVYFVPCADPRRAACGTPGQYVTVTGVCRFVDPDVRHALRIGDTLISFRALCSLEILY